MSGVTRLTDSQIITQGPIIIFLFQNNFFVAGTIFIIHAINKIVPKKLFQNKIDWFTYVSLFIGSI